MLSTLARRAVRSAASLAAGLALLAGSVGAAAAQATVDVGSPSGVLSTAHTSATFPVTLTRVDTTPVLGFSVEFTLSGNLSLEAGQSSIVLGGFLGASGANPSLQIRDLGNGQYGADGVTLGMPCGSDATSGTLFTITVSSTDPGSTGTITINSVILRDCDNVTLPSVAGTNGSVTIDNTLPVVALTSPNGGESWVGGTEQTITWNATDDSGFGSNAIDIEWSSNGGSSWLPIATGVSNSGSHAWTPPSTPTHSALVRVTARDQYDNSITDASNAVLTILGATSTSVTSTANPSVVGESVTLTATVSPAAASGSVEFFDGVTSLGTQPVAAGSAALVTSALALGSHSITGVYSGDADYSGSTSAAHSHAVNAAATTTTVGSAPNPSVVGESVALTASVAANPPGSGTPTGSVEFFDGATSLGTQPLSVGSAQLLTSALTLGSRSITAVYLGSGDFSGSTSAVHSHVVNAAATATSVGSAPNPSVVGESATLTATVAASPPGSGTPTGSVEFFDGVTSLGTQPLSSGSAQLLTSALPLGSRSITAVYLGSSDFSGSTSAAHSHAVNAAATATSVSSAPNPSVVGESVTLTASVAASPPGSGTPTGSVEFFDGVTSLGTQPLSGGSALLLTSALPLGSRSITAVYLGSSDFGGSTSAVHAHAVNVAATATSVGSAPNPSVVGEGVTLTATVAASPPGSGTPTGSVEFFDGATSLGTQPLSGGSALLLTSSLPLGSRSITAVYLGSSDFGGSTSAVHAHAVNVAATATSVGSAPNPSVVGEGVTLTATVAASPPGSGTPTGSVEFFDGATSLGTQPLSGGSALLLTSSLPLGSRSITAVYLGSSDFSGSTSAVHSHGVNAAATATSVSSSPNPSVVGEGVTLTASVVASPPGSGTPTGSVEFFDGATSLGTQPLSAGSALLVTSGLPLVSRSITAVYLGSSDFNGSTSAVHSHVVNAAGTTTSVTSAPNPSTFGQGVTLTASVASNPPGSGAPTGSVEFFDGATSLGSQPLSGGSAQLITSALAAGSRSLTAVYLGSADYTGSTSAVHAHLVNAAGVSVSLVATPDPGVYQTSETLTATLTPAGATGSVEFFDGVTSLGTSPVTAGSAVLLTSSLAVGAHSLRADYLGDSNYTPASSSVVSLEVKARITATAGANGQISPLGDVFVGLNDTPSFTFTADPGYHVSAVTVDAVPVALTSPYTFAPVSSNHTIDVQFTVNPPVAAITSLTAFTEMTGNGPSGIQRIRLDWTAVPAGSTVEVWRAPFGNYPEYNDAPGAGSIPGAPSYPPPAPWAVTSVTASGTADVPPSRDFYYYVAFVTDSYGTRSAVSNVSNGALAYALGDVSDGVTPGQGDNLVDVADISLLGSVYGRVLTPGDAYAYLDVGPTTDFAVRSRPTTDNRVNFEDLVLFGVNFGLVSAPAAAARPAAGERDELRLEAPSSVTLGSEVAARLTLLGSGTVHGLSVQLSWDPTVVEPMGQSAGEGLLQHHGVMMSPEPGTVDMMVLGAASPGLSGSVTLASVQFRVLRAGDPAIRVREVDARDVLNHQVPIQGAVAAVGGPLVVTRFAPPTPMPFHDRTSLVFSLSTRGDVDLAVFSVDGRLVRTLASGSHEAGEYRLEWNGRDDQGRSVASGAYFARLMTPRGSFTRKITYIR